MSKFARIQNNQVLDVIDFDPSGRFTSEVAALYQPVPDHVRPNATLVNGVWVNPPEPTPPTPEQLAAQQAAMEQSLREQSADEVRRKRNQLLFESDWTQLADAPVSQLAWATYRQALRDIPAQAGFPWEVQWPTQPE